MKFKVGMQVCLLQDWRSAKKGDVGVVDFTPFYDYQMSTFGHLGHLRISVNFGDVNFWNVPPKYLELGE